MADNKVEIVITGRDEAGPAFATAAAQEKAFARAIDQSNTQQVKSYQAASKAADAHLRALKLLDQVAKQEAEDAAKATENSGSRIGRVFSDLGQKITGGNGLIGAFRNLDMAGMTAFQSFGNAGTTFINPITIALGGLAAILAGPLLASLLPITLGFGTFGAVAYGEITKLNTAFNSLNTAQAQFAAAKTPTQRLAALHAEAVAMAGLNGPEKALVPLTQQLGNEVSKLMKAVQPEVIKAFGVGMQILNKLMPVLIPLAVAAGKAIDGFLKHILDWLNSGSGQKFLKWLGTDGPRDIAIFGRAMWDMAQAVGRTFDFLKNAGDSWFRNVSNGLNTIHKDWSDVINFFVRVGHDFESAWNTIKSAFQDGYNFIAGIVSKITGALSNLNGALGGIPGKILSGLGFASGGVVGAAAGGPRSGLTLVGERGPELLNIPAGSRVYNANQTAQMLGRGGGGGDTYNIHVQVGPGTAPAEVGRQLAYYLGEFKKRGGQIYRPAGF